MSNIELLNEDNMVVMARYPDKYFDLAIVDPPYGINAEHGTNRKSRKQFAHKEIGWDAEPPSLKYFTELIRVSKDQIIWGGNYFLNHLGNTRGFVIWDKLNPDRNFADCEMAWSSIDGVARIARLKRVQELNRDDNGKIHPTQKPVALYKWILDKYAKQGDKILDTHLGSGSIAIACHEYGFDLTACEIDKDYYDAAVKRFNLVTSQTSLFKSA